MEIKSLDSLSISECCEQLNIRREDLPEALQEVPEPSERDQLLIEQLQSLLNEDKLAIESCKTIEEYEGYLSTWVDGLYHSYAGSRIAQLKAEAEELAFYQKNKDSISGCEAYLQRYPKGIFFSDAQSTLVQKKKARKHRNIILLVLFLIAVGIICYCNYVPVSYVNVDDNAELNNLGSEISLGVSTDAISSTISATSSEDWLDCRVSGKTLYISANTNPKGERSATVTITAHSSFFGSELSDRKQETITVSQETGYATHLSVSNNDVYLTANGGKSSISISTDGIFAVSTAPASWVSTSINGKTLNLECGENSGIARNSYLVLKSGTKTLRLDITQAGKSATCLDVSTSDVEFSADGGTKTITVSTDGSWEFGTDTESWIDLSRSGNTITLDVSSYSGSSGRNDYFTIKSGNLEKRINITQAADNTPSAEVNRVWVDHNVQRTGYNSVYNAYWGWQQVPYTYYVMRIHVDFDVNNMKGKTIRVCAFFFDEDGGKLTTSNNRFRAPNGQVTVQNTGTANYKNSNWRDFVLEIPYGVMRKGDNKLHIEIQDNRGNTLVTSSYEYFTVN